MKTKALASWFGSNRMLAEEVGKAMGPQKWIGVALAGGMCELQYLQAPTLVVSDLHRHVINLARVVADEGLRKLLEIFLRQTLFHPEELERAQNWCANNEPITTPSCVPHLQAAYFYYICSWMGRSGKSGTPGEFKGALPVRWNGNGGDSNTRFRSAAEGLEEWGTICRRCNFHVLDAFEFLDKVKDEPKHGVYCDPPFPGAGDEYTHKFTEEDHRSLADQLLTFDHARIVCRFYDHELIRELYREADGWKWLHLAGGRKQTNEAAPEVLLVRN